MHNHHISADVLRARLIRGIDPCQIRKATILRDGEKICTVKVCRYRKSSAFAGLAMAISGVLTGSEQRDFALAVSALPKGVSIEVEDDLLMPDGTSWRIADVAPWPAVGEAAVITLALHEA